MSLRGRLTFTAAVAVAVAVALASAVVYVLVDSSLRRQVDASLLELAPRAGGVAIGQVVGGPVPAGLPSGQVITGGARFGGPVAYLQLVPATGPAVRPGNETAALPVTEATRAVARGERPSFFAEATVDGVHVRVYTARVGDGLAVQVARSLTENDALLSRLRWILAAVTLAGAGAAAAAGRMVARSGLRPVDALGDAIEGVAATKDLSRRVEEPKADEVRRLAARFNAMLAALEESQRAQRRLVADASHELRTPLTSLRANIEVLTDAERLTPEQRRRLLPDVVEQFEELSLLVSDLMDLAREPAFEAPPADDVRLDEVAGRAVRRARRHAPAVRFDLEAQPSEVRGSASRIERAMANLLDNAAKWSPPGGVVEVTVCEGEVTVRDHGAGIASEDLPHVFDRFYRSAEARGLPGSGLGLAIVRDVAESHGGSVLAGTAPGGGAVLRLRFPTGDGELLARS